MFNPSNQTYWPYSSFSIFANQPFFDSKPYPSSQPENIAPKVNIRGNEETPFIPQSQPIPISNPIHSSLFSNNSSVNSFEENNIFNSNSFFSGNDFNKANTNAYEASSNNVFNSSLSSDPFENDDFQYDSSSSFDPLYPSSPLPSSLISRKTDFGVEVTVNTRYDQDSIIKYKASELETYSSHRYRNFASKMKCIAKEGFNAVQQYVIQNIQYVPTDERWKVFVELADSAKKDNLCGMTRRLLLKAIELQPNAVSTWLEISKLEEECGNFQRSRKLLNNALYYNPSNEALIIKALKLEEKLQNLNGARSLLGRSSQLDVEEGWKILIEGALFESRNNNVDVARFVFKYLCKNIGNVFIFHEAALLEEKFGNLDKALQLAAKGLHVHPRYGPIWFTILRLYERVSKGNLSQVRQLVSRATKLLPKELKWKLYFELAQIEDRNGKLTKSREAYVKSIYHCPKHLYWRIWLAGARTELRMNPARSLPLIRKLLKRSLDEVPKKKCAQVLIDWARMEEYAGNIEEARNILSKAKKEAKFEWKVFLESILLEMRQQNFSKALKEAEESLKIHSGTGRLWAIYIQLNQPFGFESQMEAFRKALQEVPKSGEVWCEGARLFMIGEHKNLLRAKKFLQFAVYFTPQYGDSFIEYMRMDLLLTGGKKLQQLKELCFNSEPNYGTLWNYCKTCPYQTTHQVLDVAKAFLDNHHALLSLYMEDQFQATDDDRQKWLNLFSSELVKA